MDVKGDFIFVINYDIEHVQQPVSLGCFSLFHVSKLERIKNL